MAQAAVTTGVRKILIVEDHDQTSEAVSDFLRIFFPDWDLTRLASGRDALRHLSDNPPHLVILDIALMDDIDGIEVIRQAARLEMVPPLKIVLTTAMGNRAFRGPRPGRPWLDQLHDHERALVCGFFEKPVRWKTFLQELARLLDVPVPAHLSDFPDY